MAATLTMRTGRDLKRIAKELRGMDNREIRKRFGKELRAVAKPMVPAVRTAIRNIPSKRGYSADGLRGRMAAATKLEVRTVGKDAGVRIRVDGRKMPDKQKALQSYMEGVKPRWRHPVFGSDAWVQQKAHPYFFRTVDPLAARTQVRVIKAIDQVGKDIS
ncbi:hypothetical protein [Streptomyces sp. NPDC101455]|uniref:hypothetical protein n=1 Tax=Streptomyces sp. NPDC101455 TaxID=3366142 RepID=UPI00382C1986